MININKMVQKFFTLFAIVCMLTRLQAQDEPTLGIGDAAPAIKYSKWLKGTPVSTDNNDKITVLEFWATWCGPCIAAMPHLSELAKKYEKQADFIGVNVWEKTGDKPYESALPDVERFVTASKDRMGYNVIVDNNEQDMAKAWMKAAGLNGIPSTFIVKNGKIVWIGHPIKIDSVIDPIIAGTFDMAAYKKKHEESKMASDKMMKDMRATLDELKLLVENKNFDKAFALIEEAPKKQPILRFSVKLEKFNILLKHFSETEAINYVKQLTRDEKNVYDFTFGQTIIDKDGLKPESYLYAVSLFNNSNSKSSAIYNIMAKGYSKGHDFKNAVTAQEKAIELAKNEVNDPKFQGRVFDYTVTDYQKKLNEYKQQIK